MLTRARREATPAPKECPVRTSSTVTKNGQSRTITLEIRMLTITSIFPQCVRHGSVYRLSREPHELRSLEHPTMHKMRFVVPDCRFIQGGTGFCFFCRNKRHRFTRQVLEQISDKTTEEKQPTYNSKLIQRIRSFIHYQPKHPSLATHSPLNTNTTCLLA